MQATTDLRDTKLEAQALWRQGVHFMVASHPMEAVALLRECLARDPELACAWNDLGVLMETLGNYAQARFCYESALRVAPGHRQARQNCLALQLEFDLLRALHCAAA